MLKISICCRLRCWLCLLCCLLLLLLVLLLLLQSSDNHFFAELQLQPSFASWCDLRPLCGINVGAAAHKSSSCNLQRVAELAAHNTRCQRVACHLVDKATITLNRLLILLLRLSRFLIIISKVWAVIHQNPLGATPVSQLSACQSCHSY